MSRVTFIAFLAAFCGPAFGATPGVSSKTILLGQSAAFSGRTDTTPVFSWLTPSYPNATRLGTPAHRAMRA